VLTDNLGLPIVVVCSKVRSHVFGRSDAAV